MYDAAINSRRGIQCCHVDYIYSMADFYQYHLLISLQDFLGLIIYLCFNLLCLTQVTILTPMFLIIEQWCGKCFGFERYCNMS